MSETTEKDAKIGVLEAMLDKELLAKVQEIRDVIAAHIKFKVDELTPPPESEIDETDETKGINSIKEQVWCDLQMLLENSKNGGDTAVYLARSAGITDPKVLKAIHKWGIAVFETIVIKEQRRWEHEKEEID